MAFMDFISCRRHRSLPNFEERKKVIEIPYIFAFINLMTFFLYDLRILTILKHDLFLRKEKVDKNLLRC